jgi:hypothetical protein
MTHIPTDGVTIDGPDLFSDDGPCKSGGDKDTAVGSIRDVGLTLMFDVGELPFNSSPGFFVLVLEESGATVDATALPSTAISASLAAAAETNVTLRWQRPGIR